MKYLGAIFHIAVFIILLSFGAKGQVTITNPTNTTPNLAATYGSLSAAITALNSRTAISGPVTITLNIGNPQTAPAGGYAINFATITNNTFPITITGNNNTITAFSPQLAGQLYDAVFKIIGADNIIIQNFVMQENAANATTAAATNNMTEWGVALLHASITNGAQNNTIQNNTISLNRTYSNTFGIYSNARHSATVVSSTEDITNNTSGPNNSNKVYANSISNVNMGITFIGSATAANMDIGNDIGGNSVATGNTITNWGGTSPALSTFISSSGTYHCIFVNHQKDDNVSYNTLTSAVLNGATSTINTIYKQYATTVPTGTFTTTISNNTITVTDNLATGDLYLVRCIGISSPLSTATINIINNNFLNNSIGGASSANTITGIINTSQVGVMNINGNVFRGNTSTATTGGFTAITNTGAVTTTLNINNNLIGDGSGNAITFSAANNQAITGITCPTVGNAASVSISTNNFQGFVQAVAGSGAHNYISLVHPASSASTDNINNNTFTNLSANTSGSVTFIARSGIMAISAGATENCNANSIVTAFSKPAAGGTVTLYNGTSGSLSGNSMVQTGNNFSNITLTGLTVMAGWSNREGGASGPAKTITGNTFSNWTCGTSAVNVLQSDFGDNGTTVSNNTITNISGTNGITAILIGAGNKGTLQTYSNNTVSGLSAGGASALGISVSSATATTLNINNNQISSLSSSVTGAFAALRIFNAGTLRVFKNKIYDISGSVAGTIVYGIDIQSTYAGTCNIYNNYIGDLRSVSANTTNAVRGIMVSSIAATAVHNIYYNTIYINATSSGADFGTSGIFLTTSNNPAFGATSLRNNIVVNISTANGTGLTVAYRRSGTPLNNFATSSNNNIYYSGTPSASNLIFNDGTNSDQTLAAYKVRVGVTREAASFTELPPFQSTTGAAANFLHLNPAISTQAESGAVNISTYTDDFDADIRQGNPGYTGSGTAPDIGADEVELNTPVITYTPIPTPTCIYSGISITGVTITDASGIPLSGANRPRIYYRKNAGSWFSQPGTNTGGTATNSTWSFTIVETDMGGVTGGDVVFYYIIAQDVDGTPNVGSNPLVGLVATGVNSVTTAPTLPNSYTLLYNLNGLYTVGIGGNFTTLTDAVSAYNNACSLTGHVIFELIDNSYPSEVFPLSINNHTDASPIHTLTIRPSATATPLITGAVANPNPFINLNGAKYISFDGRQGGAGIVKSLTISNTGTGMTFQFINDAQNNNLRYCIIMGRRALATSGTIHFGIANAAGTGNDNNTIDHNDITDGSSQSNNGIYSSGTAGRENDNISITNNNISNYFNATTSSAGIYVSMNSSSWTITGNHFFQTATRVYTILNEHFGIYITTGSGYTINNNVIGFANEAGTGTTNMIGNSVTLAGFPAAYSSSGTAVSIRYVGIAGSFALGTPSSIDGNTIGGFAMYTSSNAATSYGMFCGIYIESGTANIGVNAGNIIGGTTGSNSIYVATTGVSGTIVGIRAACVGTVAIQNNSIGAIISSGTSAAVSGNFTGISVGGVCNFTVSNNAIGNADVDNIRIGFAVSGGLLSNTGPLSPTNVGVTAIIKGIISTSTGNTLSITNNTLRGWTMSCGSASNTGIECSGTLLFISPTMNINNNFIGTAATNWLNSTVNNTGTLYAMNVTVTASTTYNIKDNDIRGSIFGLQTCGGGGLIRLTGASNNAVTTISGNTFTNLSFRFSTGDLYFIYNISGVSASGQLIIDNNRVVGNFNGTGNSQYHMIHCAMSSAAGSKVDITNNDFSNMTADVNFSSNFFGIYSFFNGNPCLLTVTGNTFSNWTFGVGGTVGIEVSTMSGTATCSNNLVSNIASRGDVEGISLGSSGNSGLFNVMNNTITGIVSSGAGGYIYGISVYLPSILNTTQSTISNNILNGFSTTASGIVSGIFLDNGHASAIVSVTANKIYNLSGSATGCHVYGINNYTTLAGDITYTNNYIGDLRAPSSNVALPGIAGMRLFMLSGQAKVYYNTIHLNALSGTTLFSTAAIYVATATSVTLRNNIFSNVSAHGATGRTVAYWRSSTSLPNYDATSNNNLFYAGTASARDVIFYDGTNSDQTLAAYQTRVSPRDNKSVSALINFISTTGSNVNFLHIPTSSNCSVNATGNNAGILIATDYDNDARSTASPFVTDIGADEFSKKNVWTGANGTNWNDIGNWSEGIVPNVNDDNVVILNPPVNQPVIATGDVYQVASVIMGSGASLTNRGTLKIAGAVYANAASINNIQAGIVEGSMEMNGNCSTPQALAGNIFVNNAVKGLTISNDVKISAVAGEHVNVSGELGFGAVAGKTLTTGDNLTLVSTVNRTANVGKITGGNIISGKATVERYVNTGLVADGRHLKGWQFLATPTTGATVFESWQESGAAPAGYGTWITGTGTGFDASTLSPSMKFYDYGANSWTGISNTANPVNNPKGYMLFVRGDRTVTAFNQAAVPTTMRTKGTLFQPSAPPPVTIVQSGQLESVGNPYASAIDLNFMKNNSLFVNLDNDVVVWDPLLYGSYNLGGYQTLAAANNYEPTAGGTTYYPTAVASPYIQSGQAFFVRSAGPAGSVTFTEACKESSNRLVNRPTENTGLRQYFRTALLTAAGVIADGNAVVFDTNFSNAIDADDADKFANGGENFGLIRDDRPLAVEARRPVQKNDTVFYNMGNLRKQAYQLRFGPKSMQPGLKAFLVDQFLHSKTAISLNDSSSVNFSINDNPASAAAGRFYVIFNYKRVNPLIVNEQKGKPSPGKEGINILKNASISVYPNPVSGKIIHIQFVDQPHGTYQLLLTNKTGQVVYTGAFRVNNASFVEDIKLHSATAAGNYQLSISSENGVKQVLQVIVE